MKSIALLVAAPLALAIGGHEPFLVERSFDLSARTSDDLALPHEVAGQRGVSFNPAFLFRRALTCDSGYFACPNSIWCAPNGGVCCGSLGACGSGEACCSYGCMPSGGDCCSNGRYCDPGNKCIRWTYSSGLTDIVCCTDETCTAYVTNGVTSTRTTAAATTTTRAATTTTGVTVLNYYTFTVTWTHYYYYWTVSVGYSVVTRDFTTTIDTFSVQASNAAAASASATSIVDTSTYNPPASQTSLADDFGSTKGAGGSSTTPTSSRASSASSTRTVVTTASSTSTTNTSPANPAAWVDKVAFAAGLLAAFGAGALVL